MSTKQSLSGADLSGRDGRSHPPSLRRLVERAVRDDKLFARGQTVLVACSGGPDSTALLHVLGMLRKTLGQVVVAHGVDHGLRSEAAQELELVAALCVKLDISFEVTRVHVMPRSNVQARAREARHRALQEAAIRAGAAVIATGHTADDRAETVLLRLLRGAGPRGLAVMASRAPGPVTVEGQERAIDLVRPMIHARRIDVQAHVNRHDLVCAEDPSNGDPRFTRVRIRRELVPLLEDLSPSIVDHLCALADMLAEVCPDEGPLDELGRAQRSMIERARRSGERIVKIRKKGGRDVDVAFAKGKIVLTDRS
ncbi:MAG TPA: tRNA lysidine(34) synthetase TilS [Polyangium sp.]|nr:tRNA lysidine(34) synthetase TilS [Polyangium sp.]